MEKAQVLRTLQNGTKAGRGRARYSCGSGNIIMRLFSKNPGESLTAAGNLRSDFSTHLVPLQFLFLYSIILASIRASEDGHLTSCHRIFANPEGTFVSPNFPNDYPLAQSCVYDIARSRDGICGIRLTFESFELEYPDPYDGFCKKDWLAIDSCVPEGGARFCGNQTGGTYEYPFHLNADAFRLIFHSDNSTTRPGFKIKFKLMEKCGNGIYWDPPISTIPGARIPCFTQVTERKGTINSPYYPHAYPSNLDCVYEFIRESPFTCGVRMKVISFDLDNPVESQLGGACLDFFHSPGCGFMCGSLRFAWVAKYQPGATSLKFHFHSDETIERSGFKISFEQLFDCTLNSYSFPQRSLSLPNYYSS